MTFVILYWTLKLKFTISIKNDLCTKLKLNQTKTRTRAENGLIMDKNWQWRHADMTISHIKLTIVFYGKIYPFFTVSYFRFTNERNNSGSGKHPPPLLILTVSPKTQILIGLNWYWLFSQVWIKNDHWMQTSVKWELGSRIFRFRHC